MEIADWRARIDALDRQLVEMLNQRCECALAIGAEKRTRGLAIAEPSREAAVMANIAAANHARGGPLSDEALQRLFTAIVAEMRGVQRS
ncbi:MAG: chorismate mutase [Terriglobales bacterium]